LNDQIILKKSNDSKELMNNLKHLKEALMLWSSKTKELKKNY